MLKIIDLSVNIENQSILKNINLEFEQGKIFAISGQNGSGKSTLAQVIAGNPEYKIESNSKIFYTIVETASVSPKIEKTYTNLNDLTPDQRSHLGIFVSMQYPTEIPGVNLLDYLKIVITNNRKARNFEKLTTKQTLDLIDSRLDKIGWSKDFLKRNVNEGMSGGERKKCEILQMLLLDPKFIILDEIDSGLDKEALELVIRVVLDFVNKEKTLVVITHQQKILDLINPDKIIKIVNGKV